MRPLFAYWNEIAPRLAASRLIALFLDFDGTLAPIRPRPQMVRVHPAVRRVLATLARSPRFRVWVISARRRTDIHERLRIPGVRSLGLYGWERISAVPSPHVEICHVKHVLTQTLLHLPGVWIEDKDQTVAVHYREASGEARRTAAESVERAVEPWRSLLRISAGKCVWEILPRKFADKGVAVLRELSLLPLRALPVYLGDDFSDEAAFDALPHGIAVHVGGRGATRARYSLNGPAQVCNFLERLKAEFV